MPISMAMPRLGPAMDRGRIVEWLKSPGASVAKGELLVVVEAEKATVEIEAKADGILALIVAQPGEEKEVGEVLCLIAEVGEDLPDTIPAPTGAAAAAPATAIADGATVAPQPAPEGIKALPAARKLAEQHGVDLRQVKGSGPQGRIAREDVEAFIAAREAAGAETAKPAPETAALAEASAAVEGWGLRVKRVIPLTGLRGQVADNTQKSWQTAPQGTLFQEVDAEALLRFREDLAAGTAGKASVTAVITRATALALRAHPLLNSLVIGREIVLVDDVNVGVAVDLPEVEGLVVPVIRNADRLTLVEIDRELARLAESARAGRLSHAEVSGGTFTISNLGMFGLTQFTPVLNPPQSGILGVSALAERATVRVGRLARIPILPLSLTVDHRSVDGAPAARFLSTLKGLLEQPNQLV